MIGFICWCWENEYYKTLANLASFAFSLLTLLAVILMKAAA